METGKKLLVILVAVYFSLLSAASFNSSEWTDYLGNPQRTGYSAIEGPDMPEVLWKVNIPGDFDTSPFITDDKVLLLWKDSMYHLVKTKVFILDLLTGDILQEVDSNLFFKAFPVENRILGFSIESVYDLDLNSGEITFLASIPKKSFVMTNMYPLALKDRIIIPTTPAVCLSMRDFHTLWNLGETASDPGLEPVCLAGDESMVVFITSKDGVLQLLAVDPSTGKLRWRIDPLPAALWLVLGDDAVYCGGKNLWAFSRDGKRLWYFKPDQRIVSNIILGPDAVYIVDEGNNLYKIDLDGNLIWKTDCEVSPWVLETHLIGAGTILYCIRNVEDTVAVTRSFVTAYSMENGSRLWELEFGPSHYVRASPAIADGILVIGKAGGEIITLASDPHLFAKQGDAFLSKGQTEEATSSYEKAAELYERKGDMSRSQEIQEQIHELRNPSESPPPESTAPSKPPESVPSSTPECTSQPPTPESTMPTTSPEPSALIPLSAVILVVVLMGIPITYYLIKHKPKSD
ncbi:MAG: hypothetical protein AYK19_12960 [Theionarchaea archaeon DG-70-1]|nr:MAG: hypothetical protein AYK19_12960 [Theionarchaea archaeon DG-70-1]